jgi:hypothetical protein
MQGRTRGTHRPGVLLQPRHHCILRLPLGAETVSIRSAHAADLECRTGGGGGSRPDHAERVPHGDGAVAEAAGEEAEREGVPLHGGRARPGQAVEAVGGGHAGDDLEVGGVGLEVEAEDLDVGGRGEGHVDGAAHGAGGEVRRVGRERRQRRPRRALDARHRRRPAQIWTRYAATGRGRRYTGNRIKQGRSGGRVERERRRLRREGGEWVGLWVDLLPDLVAASCDRSPLLI